MQRLGALSRFLSAASRSSNIWRRRHNIPILILARGGLTEGNKTSIPYTAKGCGWPFTGGRERLTVSILLLYDIKSPLPPPLSYAALCCIFYEAPVTRLHLLRVAIRCVSLGRSTPSPDPPCRRRVDREQGFSVLIFLLSRIHDYCKMVTTLCLESLYRE